MNSEHRKGDSAADLDAERAEESFATGFIQCDDCFGEGESDGSEEPHDG